jgi:hypothetical protein
LNDVSQWEISLDHHPISVEVMFQLSGCNQYGVDQLLNLQVPGFGLIEQLADEVNRALDFVHMASSSRSTVMTVETTRSVAAM